MMKYPPHPGVVLKHDVIDVLELSVTNAAEMLGISRLLLSRVLNAEIGVSHSLAVRLEMAGLSTARVWLAMQTNYDFAKTQRFL